MKSFSYIDIIRGSTSLNREALNKNAQLLNVYLDSSVSSQMYNEYMVTAVYDQCGEIESNIVMLENRTGISEQLASGISIEVHDGKVRVSGLSIGSLVELIALDDRICYREMSEGTVVNFDLGVYMSGIYFVRVMENNEVIRIQKVFNSK